MPCTCAWCARCWRTRPPTRWCALNSVSSSASAFACRTSPPSRPEADGRGCFRKAFREASRRGGCWVWLAHFPGAGQKAPLPMKLPAPSSLSATVLASLLVLAACAKQKTAAASGAANTMAANQVVATYNGGKITYGELEVEAKPKIQELQNQMYSARREVLERMAVERIVKAEAAKKNQTEEQYIQARVEAIPVTPPTDAEVKEFYDRLKAANR